MLKERHVHDTAGDESMRKQILVVLRVRSVDRSPVRLIALSSCSWHHGHENENDPFSNQWPERIPPEQTLGMDCQTNNPFDVRLTS